MVLNFILALAPIIWLIIALSILKMPGYRACVIAAVIAAILSIFKWNLGVVNTLTAGVEGILNALWPICLVIIAALFTYNLTLETKAMDSIKSMLAGVSTDKRILVLIIGWAFGNFMEGMAGFGTAVAIPASILVGLGYDPIITVVACLVVNSTPTAFGSIAVPTVTLSNVTNIPAALLASNTFIVEALLMFLSPFFMVIIIGGGLKALKGCFLYTLIASVAFIVPAGISALFIGPELTDIFGSICAMIVTVLVARARKGEVPSEYATSNAGESSKDKPAITFNEAIKAWSPFIIIFVLLVITSSLVPAINKPLSSIASKVTVYTGENPGSLKFAWINTPGVLIIISAIIGGLIQKASLATIGRVFMKTLTSNWKTILTISSVLATAKIMTYSGMISDIAKVLVSVTGSYYPLIAPLVGAIGGFVTGSGTSTSVLFGPLQSETAVQLSMNEAWLASANSLGGGVGKMVSPQGIAIGTSAVGMSGSESKVLSKVFLYFALYVIVGGLICYFFPLLGIGIAG